MHERLRGVEGSTAELVVVFPFVMFILLLVFQFALWYHATHVAQAAAQEGARVARLALPSGAPPGTDQVQADAGGQRARDFIAGMGAFDNKTVTDSWDPGTDVVRVTVSGTVPSLVPGFTLGISEHSEGRREKFRPENAP
jgi:hypothetical protein